MRNYDKYLGMFNRFKGFMYADTDDHIADQILIDHKIPCKFRNDMGKEGTKYILCFANTKKKYIPEFEKAMAELRDKMIELGNNDYDDFCEEIFGMLDAEKRARGMIE